MTRSTPTTFGCGGNWGPAGPPELDAAHAKSYTPNKGSYDVKHRTDGLARKGWFRKELEPCEWKLSRTVLRGKGFVRIWTTRWRLPHDDAQLAPDRDGSQQAKPPPYVGCSG